MTTAMTRTLTEMTEDFLTTCRVANRTAATIRSYTEVLCRLRQSVPTADPLEIRRYLVQRQEHVSAITLHKDYRTLHAFFNWAVGAGLVEKNPLAGLKMKLPKTLPHLPEDRDVTEMLKACGHDWEGTRNKVILCLMSGSGLRRSDFPRLLVEDVSLGQRTLHLIGKGRRERIVPFGARAAQVIREWLSMRQPHPEDPMVCSRRGKALTIDYITHIVYK